jgi:hypothetical protein
VCVSITHPFKSAKRHPRQQAPQEGEHGAQKSSMAEDPENKTLLPTAWVAIGKVLGAIGRAGGGGGSDVIPFTTRWFSIEENLELELTHPSSAGKHYQINCKNKACAKKSAASKCGQSAVGSSSAAGKMWHLNSAVTSCKSKRGGQGF